MPDRMPNAVCASSTAATCSRAYRARRVGDHVLAGTHGFLDDRRLIAIGRSHDDGVYGGFRQERRQTREDRHTIPTCRRHTESPAAFGDGHQVGSLMSAQPVEHTVDLVVL